jgi:hypothetical protein
MADEWVRDFDEAMDDISDAINALSKAQRAADKRPAGAVGRHGSLADYLSAMRHRLVEAHMWGQRVETLTSYTDATGKVAPGG